MLYNVIYISSSLGLLDEYELAEILTVSRENNIKNNITGMLLYAEGTFIQVLEGKKDVLADTYKKILLDIRHSNVIELANGPLEARNFPDWAMGFASVNADVLKEFEGYIDPEGSDFLKGEAANAAMIMLRSFAEGNRLN